MKFAAVVIGLVMLGACEIVTERDKEALRQAFEAKDRALAQQEEEIRHLREALVEARGRQERECVVRGPAASPDGMGQLAALLGAQGPNPLAQPGADAAIGPQSVVGSPSPITCAADRCTVPRKTFEALLADPAELVKQARVVPYLQDGQTRGFKLFGIRVGSTFAAIGLKNGDRITAIGGHSLGGVEEALTAYAAIKGQDEWTIAGERKGAAFEQTIVIAK
ncbi:hypothetical protein [Nannocystis sp.]|uniref:hypothetical protein n=1 Tax=Nannocystis sp. TaxID=1962667 RepID=UPI0025EB129A|nr:hypothetical protein [Nannocystis sp.]MBK7829321.1 hypothetical protein [Nannocystis sp.]